ncbi:FKBP-type peptidyl-prolyl cis-trans isomerase [Agathobacter sp.]
MNKQNKIMAQEKRRAEREKQQKKDKVVKQLKFWVPIVAVVVVVIVLIWAVATSGASSNNGTQDTGAATETTSGTEDTSTLASETDTSAQTLDTEAGTVAENGDKVNIDYTGYIDGEKFQGGSTDGNGTDLTLGSGSYIDGFEDGVVGHSVGETFDLNLKFPDSYWNSDYAGKDVTFEVTLNGVYK